METYILGGALLAGIFLFVYTFIDSPPHGMYGDDQAKKVQRLVGSWIST